MPTKATWPATAALEVPERGEDDGDVGVVEVEAGAYRPGG
jgi:hypothetical protein